MVPDAGSSVSGRESSTPPQLQGTLSLPVCPLSLSDSSVVSSTAPSTAVVPWLTVLAQQSPQMAEEQGAPLVAFGSWRGKDEFSSWAPSRERDMSAPGPSSGFTVVSVVVAQRNWSLA